MTLRAKTKKHEDKMALNNRNQALVKEFESRLAFFEALRKNPYGDGTSLKDREEICGEEMDALKYACQRLNNHLDNVYTQVYTDRGEQSMKIVEQFSELTTDQILFMGKVWRDAVDYAANDPDDHGLHYALDRVIRSL
jgi:hypothetical protein